MKRFLARAKWWIERHSFYALDRIITFLRMLIGFPELWLHLRAKGYRNIELFQITSWHHSCRYLLAERDDQKVFIKLGRSFLIHNEVAAGEKLHASRPDMIPRVLDYRLSSVLSSYVCVEFLCDYSPLETVAVLPQQTREMLEKRLLEFCDELERHGIKHRDIKPANIFISNDQSDVKVIDFAMSQGPGFAPVKYSLFNDFILWDLGGGYKYADDQWNDRLAVELIMADRLLPFTKGVGSN